MRFFFVLAVVVGAALGKFHEFSFSCFINSIQFSVPATEKSPWRLENGLSITTVNSRNVKAGELIFEDNFDTLDFDKWEHERTMSGGGVRSYIF
jgi:hypothetical protein